MYSILYFVNNILETSNNLIYLGPTAIEDVQCYHIAGAADDITFQCWISSEGPLLPVKMRIVYIDQKENPQYDMTYSDGKLNEYIDDSNFVLTPPQGAELIKIIKR